MQFKNEISDYLSDSSLSKNFSMRASKSVIDHLLSELRMTLVSSNLVQLDLFFSWMQVPEETKVSKS